MPEIDQTFQADEIDFSIAAKEIMLKSNETATKNEKKDLPENKH